MANPALRVSVNGKRVCTAWVGPHGVIDAAVGWGGSPGTVMPDDGLHLRVGGIDSPAWEHVNWRVPKLKVGDVVTVEVVEADTADPAPKRRPAKQPNPSSSGVSAKNPTARGAATPRKRPKSNPGRVR